MVGYRDRFVKARSETTKWASYEANNIRNVNVRKSDLKKVSGTNKAFQYTVVCPLFVRDSGWRGTNTDKLIVDEFLDFEYRDIEEASPASALLKNT